MFIRGLALSLFFAASLALGAEVSLDGDWQLCRTATGDLPGPGAAWSTVKVPLILEQQLGKPFLWYRRALPPLPPGEGGAAPRHLFLAFGGAKFVTEVYLNGTKVGGHFGGWEPFEVEITDYVGGVSPRRENDIRGMGTSRPQGQPNDLLVRVQDVTGVVAEPLALSKRGGSRSVEQARDSVMAPIGSQPTRIGLWQPIRLIARGGPYIEDIGVRTSVRKKEIEAEITVRNLSDTPRTAKLEASVLRWPDHMGGPLLDLGVLEVTVPARSAATQILRKGWEKPGLWSPEHPILYVLSVRSVRSVGSREGELTTEGAAVRFGFREFWTDGPNLVLNGTPIKFLATAGHPHGNLDDGLSKTAALDFFRRIREAGCVAMRLHANVWPESWYEAADEVGMPIVMESALFCNPRQYALTKPEFWKNYQDHLAAIIRAKRNHPSIVIYSLENEILHCGGEQFAKDVVHRLADAGRMVKALDPTRPIMFEADGDPEGVADIFNLHYPLDFNKRNLWPDAGYWLETGMQLASWPRTFWKWDKKKPLYIGEFLHIQSYWTPDPFTTLLGDDAYRGYDWAMARCKALAWEMQIEAYRADDVSGMCPWTLTETGPFPSPDNPRYLAVKRAYAPIAAFIRERDSRFCAGETVTRTIDLYNDTPHLAKLTVEWELAEDVETSPGPKREKKVADSGHREFDTQPAQHIPVTIQLQMPKDTYPIWPQMPAGANAPTLTLRVLEGHRVVFHSDTEFRCFPRAKLGALTCSDLWAKEIALHDAPTGAWAKRFQDAGVKVNPVKDLARLPQGGVLVIAPHALDGLKPAGGIPTVGEETGPRAALAQLVRGGGSVLVLEQDSYECGLLPARLVDRGCTIAFARVDFAHGVSMIEPRGEDLRFWRGDHLVARKTIAKPTKGRFIAYVDSGGPEGLVYLPLLGVRDGKGVYLLSQLLLGEKLGQEPMAQVILESLIRRAYSHTKHPREPHKLEVVQDRLRMTDMLDEIGVSYANVSGQLAKGGYPEGGVLLVEADAPEVAQNVEKLRRFVENGSKLVLHAASREGLARLRKLFDRPVAALPSTSVPITLTYPGGFIPGLTNQDLYWYGDRSGLRWDDRTPLATDVCDHVIFGGLPEPKDCLVFKAGQMAAGEGRPEFRGDEAYLYTNGSIKTTVNFPESREYAFIVRGKGTPVGGVYPQIAVRVDGDLVGSVSTASKDWGEYCLTRCVAEGKHEVALAFANDAWDPVKGEDRNATLGSLRIGPVPPMTAESLLHPLALAILPVDNHGIFIDQVRWDKRPGDERAMRYLSNLLTNLNCDFRSPVGVLALDGSAFKLKGHPQGAPLPFTWREGVVYMGTNGTIATTVRFAKARRYEFAVRAEGTQAAGEFPNVALSLDGRKVGDLQLRHPGWHTLRLEAEVPAGEHEVGLSFTNDLYRPPEDRNVAIGGIEIR